MESALPAELVTPSREARTATKRAVPLLPAAWVRHTALMLTTLAVCYPLLYHDREWIPGFVDESDNFLGGTLIAQGHVLYRDYFSHHMPLPYYLSALATKLGAASVAGYRILASVVILSFWVALFGLLRNRTHSTAPVLTVFAIALAHPIFWGHMLLGETFAAYALLLIVALVYTSCERPFTAREQATVAVLLVVAVGSAAASGPPLAVVLSFYAWSSLKALRWSVRAWVRHHRPALLCLAAIGAGWLLILLWTGAAAQFLDQAFTFNRRFYSRYVLGDTPLLALRHVASGYYHYARTVLTPELLVGGEAVLVVAVGMVALRLARTYGLAAGSSYGLAVALARLRGVPFHDQGYYVLAIYSAATVATWAVGRLRGMVSAAIRPRRIDERPVLAGRQWRAASTGAAVVYVVLLAAYLIQAARVYPWRYGEVYWFAYHDAVQAVAQPEEPVFVGPIDPQAYLDVGRKPASKYAFYLPWMGDSPAITAQLIDDLETSQPPVIVFPLDVAMLRKEGNSMQRFVVRSYASQVGGYLAEHYVAVDDADPVWKNVLLRRERESELRQRLLAAGLR